jgi:ABC-type antimicrobial peptide transport system permease subunit
VLLREGLSVTLAAIGLGIVAASLLTKLITGLLFGTSPLDALSFSLGPIFLFIVSLAASLVPAWGAASIDPARVLRGE